MLHLITNAVAPQKRQRLAGPPTWRGRRWGLRVRGGGVRLGLLLRLRVRLSGVVGLLLRYVEELRCRSAGRVAACRWSSAPRSPVLAAQCRDGGRRPERDQSSFYAEAIADCLEFIKSRSSYCPVNGGRV
ncbi:unnamed protein product [Urochloa humidicola]